MNENRLNRTAAGVDIESNSKLFNLRAGERVVPGGVCREGELWPDAYRTARAASLQRPAKPPHRIRRERAMRERMEHRGPLDPPT